MDIPTFWEYITTFRNQESDIERHDTINQIIQDHPPKTWKTLISILSYSELNNVGVSETTIKNSIEQSTVSYSSEKLTQLTKQEGTLTKALLKLFPIEDIKQYHNNTNKTTLTSFTQEQTTEYTIEALFEECITLHELSGNTQRRKLTTLLETYHPPTISFLLLNDLSTNIEQKTITVAVGKQQYSKKQIERARSFTTSTIEFINIIQNNNQLPMKPTVGTPFDPMLAKDKQIPANTDNWVSQYKLDGYRVLIHITPTSVQAFSRTRENLTNNLPELQQIDWPNGEYILDTEAIAYNNQPLNFNKTSQRIDRKHNINKFNFNIRFYAFDLILHDSKDISRQPLHKRINLLKQLPIPDSDYYTVLDTKHNINKHKKQAKKANKEGIIIKDQESSYRFGMRSNNWRKHKFKNYTVDLQIVGIQKERGDTPVDRAGKLELATKHGKNVGIVGTGLDDQLKEKIWNNKQNYLGTIAEIKFEGFTDKLRFPVFKTFRHDTEADTIDKIQQLTQNN